MKKIIGIFTINLIIVLFFGGCSTFVVEHSSDTVSSETIEKQKSELIEENEEISECEESLTGNINDGKINEEKTLEVNEEEVLQEEQSFDGGDMLIPNNAPAAKIGEVSETKTETSEKTDIEIETETETDTGIETVLVTETDTETELKSETVLESVITSELTSTVEEAVNDLVYMKIVGPTETGVILDLIEVAYIEDMTAFDLLLQVSQAQGITVDYSKTGGMGYVKGIANVYEFDYGATSGWLYVVNNEILSVSASTYILQQKDTVTWIYSKDLGKDIQTILEGGM
jgi:hypothetical protein